MISYGFTASNACSHSTATVVYGLRFRVVAVVVILLILVLALYCYHWADVMPCHAGSTSRWVQLSKFGYKALFSLV